MYSKITNPLTGRKVSINGKVGKNILRNYINVLVGGTDQKRLMAGLMAAQRKTGMSARPITATTHNLGVGSNMRIASYLPDADPIIAFKNKWSKFIEGFGDVLRKDGEFDFLKEDFLQAVAQDANMNNIRSHFRDVAQHFEINTPKGWKGVIIEDMRKVGLDYVLDGKYKDYWGNWIQLYNFRLIADRTSGILNFRYIE